MKNWYNPAQNKASNNTRISLMSLFSWVAVLMVIVLFWTSVAVAYKRDYVPHAIAKIEHKEKTFLASHKSLQKKLGGTHTMI